MEWDGQKLRAVVNMIKGWFPQIVGNSSRNSKTNKSVSKDSATWWVVRA